MNIFFLDRDPVKAAQYHCDKHVVKMILETAQLLSTAHHALGSKGASGLYKPTHQNHPCGIWVRESAAHYIWAHNLLKALLTEYTRRYGRLHAVQTNGIAEKLNSLPDNIYYGPFVDPPQCMPDVFKVEHNPVAAYRNYYRNGKAHIARWKTTVPYWWNLHLFFE